MEGMGGACDTGESAKNGRRAASRGGIGKNWLGAIVVDEQGVVGQHHEHLFLARFIFTSANT